MTVKTEFAKESSASSGQSMTIDLDLTLDPQKVFEVYHDTVFGLLAFREYLPEPSPIVSAAISGSDGERKKQQLVSLVVDGVRHFSNTDNNGVFTIRGIESPRATVRVGSGGVDADVVIELPPRTQ